MHHIYRTKAIVISDLETKEADKDLLLLTEDFGLIRARAQGIRKNTSKLKFALQIFSLCDVALVRGKAGYRITNAKIDINFFYNPDSKHFIKSISRVFVLFNRLIRGEDFNQKIYHHTESVIKYFIKNSSFFDQQKSEEIEIVLVSKMLYELGYFDKNNHIKDFIETDICDKHFVFLSNLENKKSLINEINKAIKETQL
jgi:DNA repair protein RecO